MSVKNLLVHVNVSKHCRSRLEIAARLAKAFDAHLTGLYTSAVGDVAFFMMEDVASQFEPRMQAWWLRLRDRAKAEFDGVMRAAGVVADWIEVQDSIGTVVPYHARYADLTIIGQIDREELLPRPEYEIPERVTLESGRPVLLVPYAGTFAHLAERVLVAWNGSAQSARALKDALPFLTKAQSVTVLTINPESVSEDRNHQPGTQMAAYLSHHGIAADMRELTVDDIAVGEMILSQAADMGADMIVMGAYGHPRAREIVLGGATRTLFGEMTVPVLMSH